LVNRSVENQKLGLNSKLISAKHTDSTTNTTKWKQKKENRKEL